ncbi:MAG: type II secretion system F family protein [Planctomycetota bacterium]
MLDGLIAVAFAVVLVAFVVVLSRPVEGDTALSAEEQRVRPSGSGGGWIAVAAAILIATVTLALAGPVGLAIALALLFGVAVHVGVQTLRARREVAFELALASSLDLTVASLRSGAALADSLESAAFESQGKVREMLTGIFDRLRLGEPSTSVLDDTSEEYPYEGVRLFTLTLGAHLDSGGSAATSMGEIARAIRDRVDVIRRTTSQSAETQASVVGILAITYGLAYLMWNQYPDRVETFAASDLGLALICLSIILQAAGIGWIWSMVRVKV